MKNTSGSTDRELEKLEEEQKERYALKHSIQSDYLALRRLVGQEAEDFVAALIKVVF